MVSGIFQYYKNETTLNFVFQEKIKCFLILRTIWK